MTEPVREIDSSPIDNVETEHEHSDVNVSAVLIGALVLIVSAIVVHLLMFALFQYFQGREVRQTIREYPLADIKIRVPEPEQRRIQARPAEDLQKLRNREDAVLTNYGWNNAAGVARIPIDQAMKLVVERGLPVRPQSPAPADEPTESSAPKAVRAQEPPK